jgi:hypothetical protein
VQVRLAEQERVAPAEEEGVGQAQQGEQAGQEEAVPVRSGPHYQSSS